MSTRFTILSADQAIELDRLCDRFEDDWREGRAAEVESYLPNLEGPAYRSALAMMLELEIDLRRERGETVDRGHLFRRFPEYQDTVLEVLEAERETQTDVERGTLDLSSTRLGRYQFAAGKPLGEGTFGKVYQAWDARLQRSVAIKVPRPDKLDKDVFLREARAVSQLKHRNICTVFDVDEDEGRPYMVMELIEGPKLSERLGRGRLDPAEAVRIVYEVALALEEAHRQGVVHRDLKPTNIMLRNGREPVVLDFGLAKVAAASETLMTANTALGTALYMPPEQATGDHLNVGPPSDVYSLGMVLYEALTGELPFSGTARSVIEQVKTREIPTANSRQQSIPQGLAAACAKASSKRVQDRYASMGLFAAALAPYLPEDHPGRRFVAAPLARRRRLFSPLGVTAAALVVAVAIGAGGWASGWFASPAVAPTLTAQQTADNDQAASDNSPSQLTGGPSLSSPGQNIDPPSPKPSELTPREVITPEPTAPEPTTPAISPPPQGSENPMAPSLGPALPPANNQPGDSPPADSQLVVSQPAGPTAIPAVVETPPASNAEETAARGPTSNAAPGPSVAAQADTPASGGEPAPTAGPPPAVGFDLSQINALVERFTTPPADPNQPAPLPADAVRESLDLGLDLWRGTENDRREFWDHWRERLQKPASRPRDEPAATEGSGSATGPAADMPATSPAPARIGPLRQLFRPRER